MAVNWSTMYACEGFMQGAVSVAAILNGSQPGDERSMAELLPLVYAELRALAAAQLEQEHHHGREHTLQPTALVHEAFLKLTGNESVFNGQDHFKAIASIAMRQVLVDHARKKTALKRGGETRRQRVSLEGLCSVESETREFQVLELDSLLRELAGEHSRAARVAEMRLFGGMEIEGIGRVLGISRMTANRDWLLARAWLAGKIQGSRTATSVADECP